MAAATVLCDGSLQATDYRCGVGPADQPFVERCGGFDLAYAAARMRLA